MSINCSLQGPVPAAALFRSLGDPTRLAIVLRLAESEDRVVDLTRMSGLAQSTVSKHVSCLPDCGLPDDPAGGEGGSEEIVCHGDLGPHNTVFRGHTAVALIVWDDGVRPGRRAVDFALAVWCFADLCEDDVPLPEQARRARLMCSTYPVMTPAEVVEELVARFQRARHDHAAAHRPGAVEVFDRLLAWMSTNGTAIAEPG